MRAPRRRGRGGGRRYAEYSVCGSMDVAAGEAKRSAGRDRGPVLYFGLGVCVSSVYLYLSSV